MTTINEKAHIFWQKHADEGKIVLTKEDFPNEYIRRFLIKKSFLYRLRRNLYILKNPLDSLEDIIYKNYWQIAATVLKRYYPWSIEKENALSLWAGSQSIPNLLKVRTAKIIKNKIKLPFHINISVRPDKMFKKETSGEIKINNSRIFLDLPEKIIFEAKNLEDPNLKALIKGHKFNKLLLEALYSKKPKPIVAKRLIKLAKELGQNDLQEALEKIAKEYTYYRF